MIALVEDNRDAIVALCERFGVRRLALFGSAAKGTFDPATSDLDFVVDYFDWGPGIFHRFFGFIVALEDLLGHQIDVVTEPITKSWLRKEIQSTQVMIYESTRSQSAA